MPQFVHMYIGTLCDMLPSVSFTLSSNRWLRTLPSWKNCTGEPLNSTVWLFGLDLW